MPYEILEDINRRIGDWLAAGGSRDDPYIWKQVRAAENAIAAIKRKEHKNERINNHHSPDNQC